MVLSRSDCLLHLVDATSDFRYSLVCVIVEARTRESIRQRRCAVNSDAATEVVIALYIVAGGDGSDYVGLVLS